MCIRDSDESEGKTESMFIVSTHLNLRKQNHIDLYSVNVVSSDKEKKEEEVDVIVSEEEPGVESEFVDPEFSKEKPTESKPSEEPSQNKRFLIRFPKIDSFSWKTKPEKKEPRDEENGEDNVIVPEEDFGVESENVEKDPDFNSPDEPDQNTDKKNWTFRLPSFVRSKTNLNKDPMFEEVCPLIVQKFL